MLDYQAIIKSDTATRLLNVFTFEYKCGDSRIDSFCAIFGFAHLQA